MEVLQAIHGRHPAPERTPAWRYLERCFAGLLDGYTWRDRPILVHQTLHARGIETPT